MTLEILTSYDDDDDDDDEGYCCEEGNVIYSLSHILVVKIKIFFPQKCFVFVTDVLTNLHMLIYTTKLLFLTLYQYPNQAHGGGCRPA